MFGGHGAISKPCMMVFETLVEGSLFTAVQKLFIAYQDFASVIESVDI